MRSTSVSSSLEAWQKFLEGRLADSGSLPSFEKAADEGFRNVRETYAGRGLQYGDTWQLLEGIYDADERRADAHSLIRIKLMRVLYTKGQHRDSLVDLVAYTCAYLQWMDEGAAGEEW